MLFRILDKDNTGKLQGKEVEAMFNAVLGFDTGSYEGDSAFDMEQVSDIIGSLHRRHPSWNVPANVVKFIKEHKDDAEGGDEGPMGDRNMALLFKILDKDGSGVVDNMEAYRFFAHIGVPARYLFLKSTEPMDAETFSRVIREVDDEHPEADLEDKIVTFIQDSLANGKADFEEVGNPEEEPPAPESTGSGRKRALLVGINYIGSDHSLGGCINDVTSQGAVLREHFDFEDMRTLTDDQDDESLVPTKTNIVDSISWLVEGAQAGDQLFFQYSGHGSQTPNKSSEEADGMDECLCPSDCLTNPWPEYVITDKELDAVLSNLPEGVGITMIFDCCHSGTMADLAVSRDLGPPAGSLDEGEKARFMDPPESIQPRVVACRTRDLDAPARTREVIGENKDVWTISGCQDSQTSSDATIGGERRGALTWALLTSLEDLNYKCSYDELFALTKKKIRVKGFAQIPALSTTKEQNLKAVYMGGGH
jgi:Ca2+-binding EF-hand superfamily protein